MLEGASLVTILQKTQLLIILEETAGTKDLDFQKTDLVKQDIEFIKEFTSKSAIVDKSCMMELIDIHLG